MPVAMLYDPLRSENSPMFASAVCVESGDGPNTETADATALMPGELFYYLIRAENSCPSGQCPRVGFS